MTYYCFHKQKSSDLRCSGHEHWLWVSGGAQHTVEALTVKYNVHILVKLNLARMASDMLFFLQTNVQVTYIVPDIYVSMVF